MFSHEVTQSQEEVIEGDGAQSQQLQEDLAVVISTPQGRRFIWSLLGQAGLFCPSFHADALHMAFAEGARNLGLQLFQQLNQFHPEGYVRMQQEQMQAAEAQRQHQALSREDAPNKGG
ncbi:Bbp19 family protein [Magnetococcus sp. PR-3]|uniref:Bbp19 family protein n=1 Tax=Magnetococcus sp. PR-3 TaxID=3120355 RepID=UPI002FCE5214